MHKASTLKIIFGVDGDIKLYKGFLVGRSGSRYIAKGFLIVRDVSRVIDDISIEDNLRILTTYIGILNKPYPIDLRISVIPLDKESMLKKLDNVIHTRKAMLEMDPSNESISTEIERLVRLKNKILSGELPFKLIAIYSVSGDGATEKEAIEIAKNRLNELREELSTIGIRTEVLGGLEAISVLNRFFRS